MREAPVVPDQMDAMNTLSVLRGADVPMAFVHDEYGHFERLVTPADLLSALAGVFAPDVDIDTEPPLVERDDGGWRVSGSLAAEALADWLSLGLPSDSDQATEDGLAPSGLQ